MATLKIVKDDWDLLQQNKPIMDKWIAGLRSGKWVQTTGAMTNIKIPNSACCLMVMEAECNNKTVNDYIEAYNDEVNMPAVVGLPADEENPLKLQLHGLDFKLPQNIHAIFKCDNSLPRLASFNDTITVPSQWNDNLKLSFEEIATLLETGFLNKDFSV